MPISTCMQHGHKLPFEELPKSQIVAKGYNEISGVTERFGGLRSILLGGGGPFTFSIF